ncbi:MAG TPA: DUF3465 domain-containing protein [Candidatus Baltobacteraceae bacterium]|nr:DUF3465 domain-containing protein [Candidatus Baltobacteraceae bacterium]
MEFPPPFKAVAVALFALAGCAAQTSANDAAVCDAYNAGRSHVEVVADGRVTRVLGIQNGRVSPHEGFLMRLNSGCNAIVRVEVNTDLAGTFPVSKGDPVTVKGEYEYYSRGGVIHWTHHDPRFHHEAGFIEIGGKTYE